MIKVGSDFSGVGAFNQALIRLGVDYEEVFACDMDKYARQTFIHNYGHPIYYPTNVYDRSIPIRPLDIYMTSPPCQAFSLAGKRLGKDDKRGVLFFNSHEFIKENNPRYFIFENVKGLLSDDNGNTFNEWVNMLGGKSVNGLPVMFPYEDSVPYHLYWKVLNAKNYGVPQNRERVFLVGIRDDKDNTFRWPVEERLNKRLKDVLESDVDEKYYLSEKMIDYISKDRKGNNNLIVNREIANTLTCCMKNQQRSTQDNYIKVKVDKIGYINQDTQASQVYSDNGISQTMTDGTHGYAMGYIQVKSATSKGYEEAFEGDSINFSVPNSETRRGRVGKQVAQTLDTACNQGVMVAKIVRSEEGKQLRKESMANGKDYTPFQAKEINFQESDVINCITTATTKDNLICRAIRGRGDNNQQQLELNSSDYTNSITTVQKDNVLVFDDYNNKIREDGLCGTITEHCSRNAPRNGFKIINNYQIRRLTPRECFRLMDFPDSFTWPVSDSQAYKQAGNSIVVNVLYNILKKLNL